MKIKNYISEEDIGFLYDCLIFFDIAALALTILSKIVEVIL